MFVKFCVQLSELLRELAVITRMHQQKFCLLLNPIFDISYLDKLLANVIDDVPVTTIFLFFFLHCAF